MKWWRNLIFSSLQIFFLLCLASGIQPLRTKAPSFTGDQKITLLWKERTKASIPSSTAAAGKKRNAAANGSNRNSAKRGRGMGGLQNLLNKAFEGLNGGRAGGRGGARRGGWRGRGRGRSYR
ncbi:apoptosis inhibitor 5-like protein API5 [Olea europaea var. sylvestris]|uniref:apoptosis inhibitor 5-like protein API5 n=1 Tax=Olea europaea var. sylvestris TaxID=158386 RepID=UPI000C1D2BAA|nr:apoptosis inhibitor 5-like protein API5 [Olea europaea var. sylvestris]